MSLATFTWVPHYSTRGTINFRAQSSKFGDGYEQRLSDGINTVGFVFDLSFSNARSSEIKQMTAFLVAHGGVTPFIYQPPSPYDYHNSPTYAGGTAYEVGDSVKQNNVVYVCVQAGTGQAVTNTAYWMPIAKLPMIFICRNGDWGSQQYDANSFSAKFEQVFDNVV